MISVLCFLIAGFFRGFSELLCFHHHKSIFSGRVHPLSFFGSRMDLRKYKYSKDLLPPEKAPDTWYYRVFDIQYKEKFLFSATAFVFLTDAFHFSNFINKHALVFAIVFSPWGFHHTWQEIVLLVGLYSGAWALGFFLSYNLIFQKR